MNNAECIAVATEVWGKDSHALHDWFDAEEGDLNERGLRFFIDNFDNWLRDKVLSWSGVGKTFERMRGRPDRHEFFAKSYVAMAGYLGEGTGKNVLFESTHLAALSAVRGEG